MGRRDARSLAGSGLARLASAAGPLPSAAVAVGGFGVVYLGAARLLGVPVAVELLARLGRRAG